MRGSSHQQPRIKESTPLSQMGILFHSGDGGSRKGNRTQFTGEKSLFCLDAAGKDGDFLLRGGGVDMNFLQAVIS